jgi:hypothetical protein
MGVAIHSSSLGAASSSTSRAASVSIPVAVATEDPEH